MRKKLSTDSILLHDYIILSYEFMIFRIYSESAIIILLIIYRNRYYQNDRNDQILGTVYYK